MSGDEECDFVGRQVIRGDKGKGERVERDRERG